jgi:hypothetical protein
LRELLRRWPVRGLVGAALASQFPKPPLIELILRKERVPSLYDRFHAGRRQRRRLTLVKAG